MTLAVQIGFIARRSVVRTLRQPANVIAPLVFPMALLAVTSAGLTSATIFPWSMIPTRSARASASSRYWVVRKTVTPSSRASLATSSQSALRLWTSSPVVGSSRKRIVGLCASARARSSRRFIPPE